MMTSPVDAAWGTRLLGVMRVVTACSLAIALAEYLALKILERQDSCLAYVEPMPLVTISVGIAIAGATAVLAAFAAHFERFVGLRLQHTYRVTVLALVPVALGLCYLSAEYVPLVQTYLADPEVFCD